MKQCLKRSASATILKAAEGCKAAAIIGAKRIANTAKRGVKNHAKNKTRYAEAVKAVVWAHVSMNAKLHVKKAARQVAKKVANLRVKNLANAEAVKVAAKADVKRIISVLTVRIANPHVRNRHSAEVVNPDAKHRVSQAVKQERKPTQHQAYLLQLQFQMKLRAATQLSFSGVRQATAIYRDISYKKRPTAERGHKFTKVHQEASRTPSQSAQVRFSTVLRLTIVTA